MTLPSGVLIVLTGPSGVGKGTLRHLIAKEMPWLKESISATTRPKRPSETEGVEYYFVSRERFDDMVRNDELIEWAEYAGNLYGTPKKPIEEALAQGTSLLLEVEVQGALRIRELFPKTILIFIAPPSLEALESRLRDRNTNTEEDIQRRLAWAKKELAQQPLFDHVLVNDTLETCKQMLESLLQGLLQNNPNPSSAMQP